MTEIYFNNGRVICVNVDIEEIKRALSQEPINQGKFLYVDDCVINIDHILYLVGLNGGTD